MDKLVSVFACEPQPITVEGLRRVFERQGEFLLAGWAADAAETVARLPELAPCPDVILVSEAVDLRSAMEIRRSSGARLVLWATDLDEREFYRPLQLGFYGIVRKTQPTETLLQCLRAVGEGGFWVESPPEIRPESDLRRKGSRLTPREAEIARLAAAGMRNRDIAGTLSISPGTVKVHLMHVFEKLGIEDRFQLAVHAGRLLEPVAAPEPAETH